MSGSYILDIQWDRPSSDSPVLPPLVGPFETREEARQWAALNIPNGSWEVRPLAWPYMPPRGPGDPVGEWLASRGHSKGAVQ